MNTEKEIKKEVERLVKDHRWDKARALSFLHSKFQSENRFEEAEIVGKLIHKEESEEELEYKES